MTTDYSFIRPSKAEFIRYYQQSIEEKNDLQICYLENGIILPLKQNNERVLLFGNGGCLNGNGEYVALSEIKGRIEGKYEITELVRSEKKVIYCGYIIDHWGHFLIEAITRLWYALENGNEYDEFVFFTRYGDDYKLKGNYKYFFELLHIDSKVRIINKPTQYKLIAVPESAYTRVNSYSTRYLDIFNIICKNVLQSNKKDMVFPEKIFLSRSLFYKDKKNNYQEYGLDMLDNFFEKNGYTILYPEQLPLNEMVNYLQHAKICASESGSCAHNFLFAPRNAKLEIIERQGYINEIQANLDVIIGCSVTYIDAYYTLFPVDAAGGPYLLFYTKWLELFRENRNYLKPDDSFFSESAKEKAIKWFLKSYYRRYGRTIPVSDAIQLYFKVFAETMEETYTVFRQYVDPLPTSKRYILYRIFIGIFGRNALNKVRIKYRRYLNLVRRSPLL